MAGAGGNAARFARRAAIALVLPLLLAREAAALGPHEIAVLVNDASPRSLEVANHYVHLRRVPDQNIVHLELPDRVREPEGRLTREEFTRLIWEPAQHILRERQLQDHILAWVYSVDFPIVIAGDQEVSLMGLTLVRDQLPPDEVIRGGRYLSPLFAGPGETSDRKGAPRSLEQYAAFLQTNMPLPSMMLSHAGTRGLAVADIVERLRLLALSDATPPRGDVAFVLSDDIRSTCRAWQFGPVVQELKSLGVAASASSNPPPSSQKLLGLMMGTPNPNPAALGALAVGSMAEHLTSFSAIFSNPDQTKMTAWLRAGAAGSRRRGHGALRPLDQVPARPLFRPLRQRLYAAGILLPVAGLPAAAPAAGRSPRPPVGQATRRDAGGPAGKRRPHQGARRIPGQHVDQPLRSAAHHAVPGGWTQLRVRHGSAGSSGGHGIAGRRLSRRPGRGVCARRGPPPRLRRARLRVAQPADRASAWKA